MKLFLVIITISFSLISPVSAQIDQRCWTQKQCTEYRQEKFLLSAEEAADGFYNGDDAIEACGTSVDAVENKIGFCLPAGKTTTKITFGSQSNFEHIGDFIKFMFRYSIPAASIIAAVFLIIAGLQWTISGGNSELRQSAQKRIANALIGLFLIAISYTVLNTLNPALVNLRLPQIWMINTQGLTSVYCTEGKKALALFAKQDDAEAQKQKTQKLKEVTGYLISPKATVGADLTDPNNGPTCGYDYFVKDTGGLTCHGSLCKEGNVCYKKLSDKTEACHPGTIAGIVETNNPITQSVEQSGTEVSTAVGLIVEGWEWEWMEDPEVYRVCNDGNYSELSDVGNDDSESDEENLKQEYWIKILPATIQNAEQDCKKNNGLKGFVLSLDFNEVNDPANERHAVGRLGHSAVDLGDIPCLAICSFDTVEKIAQTASTKYFITAQELQQGLRLDVDVAKICDIDANEIDRKKCYGKYGY